MKIGEKNFDLSESCLIMGILNVTPDSFSDGGRFNDIDSALRQAEKLLAEGADIIDIGGESTRPGYVMISEEEEIERTAPVIQAVRERFGVPISLDTYKYKVAEAGIQAGADLINDIWGLRYDSGEMAALIAENNIPCCLMHNRHDQNYSDFFEDLISDMGLTLDIALNAGIKPENILIDPGVGFAKSYENNLETIDRIDEFDRRLGFPVLLGASRKSVIGLTLDLPSDQRLEGTIAISVAGAMKGVSVLRVHDVKENLRAVKMALAIMKGYKRG